MDAEKVRLRILAEDAARERDDAIKERDNATAAALKMATDAGAAEEEAEWAVKRLREVEDMNDSVRSQRADLKRQLEALTAENRRITAEFFRQLDERENTIGSLRERVRAAEGQMGQTIATSLESIKTLTAERDRLTQALDEALTPEARRAQALLVGLAQRFRDKAAEYRQHAAACEREACTATGPAHEDLMIRGGRAEATARVYEFELTTPALSLGQLLETP